ncbi:MAG: DNA primase, partial [Acinetobacter tandoii]
SMHDTDVLSDTLDTLDQIVDNLPDDHEQAVYYCLGACHLFSKELAEILKRTDVSNMLETPERASNHAAEYSLGLQNKYLRNRMKKPTSLKEMMNLRQQLNELTKKIGLRLLS